MLSLLLSALALQPTDCPSPDVNLPPALMPWEHNVAVPGTALARGQVNDAPTSRPLTLEIMEAGTYAIALAIGAWIEVARDGQRVRSAAHGHGPPCSTIRKIVDFRLEPGAYTVTLSRTDQPSTRLFVLRR